MRIRELALALVVLASCGDITLPPPQAETFLPGYGTWDGQAGEVLLTLHLQERRIQENLFTLTFTSVQVSGSGTYAYPGMEAPDTFEVSGYRSGAGRADFVLNLWGLGQLRGSMTDRSTIQGTLSGGSPDLGYTGPFPASGSAVVLRRR
jgi:hypothetical protein